MGDKQNQPFQLSFNGLLKIDFQGSRVTSDGGLILVRELDERLGFGDLIVQHLTDSRRGKNTQLPLADLLRQSVYSRIAGYEDVNDAERVCHDPVMRWVVGDRAITGSAASASQMGRFETKWLSRPENLAALADLPGRWIDTVHRRRPKVIVLDMDASESPTYGEQESSAYNGHFGCMRYHPLFVFNQFGDVERCALRPGNVHSADGWRAVLEPVIPATGAPRSASISGATRPLPILRCTSFSKLSAPATRSAYRPTGSCRTGLDTYRSARSGGHRRKCAASTPASAIRRRAGKSRDAS